MIGYGRLNRSQRVNRMWKANRSWQRKKTNCFDGRGIAISDAYFALQYLWSYCVRYSETPNLLRITLEDQKMILIPKRAIAEGDMLRMRVMIHGHISEGKFLSGPGTFEVVKPQAVIPISES